MIAAARRAGDAGALVAIGLICVLMVGGLYAGGRGAPSAGTSSTTDRITHPRMSADEVCTTWATWWTVESGVGAPAEALEAMSNCRETTTGEWVVPADPFDARLMRPAPRAAADGNVAARRADVQAQVAALDQVLPDSVRSALASVHASEIYGVTGGTREDRSLATAREVYAAAMAVVFADPAFAELAAFSSWATARRQAGYDAVLTACSQPGSAYLLYACEGMRAHLGIDTVPWPWDLADPGLIETWLTGVETNGGSVRIGG
jgi:hypothetical protein